ncbi:hypothetical protein JCGZ_09359 [Jatropha curcas]|uniref:RING-type domain-containing protein n=1 Tax=Jatropha curcas TaxID=180498 RepID=A0A067KSH4_JATCU|nr:E3 ubiquitin-protein ligase RHA2B [Jatropha curcas]KDP35200.1 hypothetical protein JCGZ_09359 [Jatropha curcas]
MAALSLSQLFSVLKLLSFLFIKFFLINTTLAIQSLIAVVVSSGPRVLTAAQFLSYIEEKIPAIRYTKSLIWLPESPGCAVCLSEFVEDESVRNLKCKHLFHKDCVDQWFQQCRSTCPLCRTMVLPDKVVGSYRRPKDDDETEFDRSEGEIVFLVSPLHGNGIFTYFW